MYSMRFISLSISRILMELILEISELEVGDKR